MIKRSPLAEEWLSGPRCLHSPYWIFLATGVTDLPRSVDGLVKEKLGLDPMPGHLFPLFSNHQGNRVT
jgi:hypothetical protein